MLFQKGSPCSDSVSSSAVIVKNYGPEGVGGQVLQYTIDLTIVFSQSPEVSESSYSISLYTHSDPPLCPRRCPVVPIWHHSLQVGEKNDLPS